MELPRVHDKLRAPDEQGIILAHVKASGGTPDVGFDRYEDITVYVKWSPLK